MRASSRAATSLSRPFRRPRGASPIFTLGTAAAMMALLLAAQDAGPVYQQLLRLLCIVPVGLAAYRRDGMWPALAMTACFASTWLWQSAWRGQAWPASDGALEQASATLFLALFAYVAASIAASLWAQGIFSDAVTRTEGLLARASDLDDAAVFIASAAAEAVGATRGVVLHKSPLDGGWYARGAAEPRLTPPLPGESATLAWWLTEQGQVVLLNDLNADPRFVASSAWPVRSLLAQPLRERDGDLAAVLVLLDKRPGPFTPADGDAVARLAEGAGRALEQAGLFALTDQALARRARQLGALQRAAHNLNKSLETSAIVRRALAAVVELTAADAALVALSVERDQPVFQARGARSNAATAIELLERAHTLDQPTSDAARLLSGAAASLLVPVRRSGETLGVIVIESGSPGAFEVQDWPALIALADHIAVAVANARLFQEIRQEEARTALILRTLADGLLTTDAQGTITSFNPAAELLTGRETAEVVGRSFREVLGCPEDQDPRCSVEETLGTGQVVRDARWPLEGRDGQERILSISAAPMMGHDHPDGMVLVLRDVTEHEALERFQRELTAAFSHGLRTPLASILAAADMLLAGDGRPEAQHARLETIRAQAQRLNEFTERTLDVQRLDAGRWQLDIRPLPAELVTEDVVTRARAAVPGSNISLRLPRGRVVVWGDEGAVQTVLDNLLENALKYAPAGSPVAVQVERCPDDIVRFAVLDAGPGIPEGERERVFERFYRLDGGDAQRVYGHGLGLYIARRLVERMNGRIWVEAGPAGGSRFAFTLPAFTGEDLG